MLFQHIEGFLNHLRVEKNASGMTIVSYRTDLNQFFEFLSHVNSLPPEMVSKESFNHKSVRDYLTHLQNNGISRATMARKLATLRSFVRYLCREEVLKGTRSQQLPLLNRKRNCRDFYTSGDSDSY